MPRPVKEWVGASDTAAVPARVRLRIFEAAGGCCAACSQRLSAGRWHLDHITPLWDGGEHREGNLQPLCAGCHGGKTSSEASERAEGRRHRMKAAGIKKRRRGIPYRRFNGEIVWPSKPT